MGLMIARFFSLLFVALVSAPALAHLLELPNKSFTILINAFNAPLPLPLPARGMGDIFRGGGWILMFDVYQLLVSKPRVAALAISLSFTSFFISGVRDRIHK